MFGCAKAGSISGGPKDDIPPQPLEFSPPLFTTGFSQNEFTIEFDEYVQVKEFGQQLIVSPPLKKKPDYSIRGKRVRVTWQDSLRSNTTYQFNFGKSIVDLNEGNANLDLVYVFSTGTFIDSLEIKGRIMYAKDNEPVEKASIMLYRSLEDSMPLTTPPDYFGLSDATGYYSIKYLPEGSFKRFALLEENNNYLYDGPPELIAFSSEPVMSSYRDSSKIGVLQGFIENDTSQYISSQTGKDYGFYLTVFNVPAAAPLVKFADPATGEEFEAINLLNTRRDSLKSWIMLPKENDLEEIIVYTTDGVALNDTSYWYLETDAKYKEKAELKITTNTNRSKLNLNKTFSLTSNNPLQEVDTSLVYFLEDSVRVYPRDFEKKSLNRNLLVHYAFKKDATYIFKATAGAFKDIYDTYSDSLSIPFSLQDSEYYGSLTVNIKEADSTATEIKKVLQLLNASNQVVATETFEGSLQKDFPQLEPGQYSLKLIFDENGDGEWNTGIYCDGVFPERLSIYPEEL